MIEARSALSSDRRWWLALLATICLVLSVNPLGFIGGGWDDWQYLNAVRCWREFGPCLPHDHWQGRWPVIAPVALLTWLFGESRMTVSLAPFAASVACLVLLAVIGNRTFGKPIGWIAAMLMATVPAFSIQFLDITVESIELGFCLLGLLAIILWVDGQNAVSAFLGGLSFGLAIQVRETATIAAAFAAIYAFRQRRPRVVDMAAAAVGFLLPLLIEFVIFAVSTGDPFWRRRLSLNHTQIPSSELQGPVDPKHSPLFNRAYIANWRREPGIHIYWAIDGLLNLFADAKAALSLGLVPLIALVARNGPRSARRSALVLWCVALAYICVLIYVLAVDPKARMFYVPLALTNTALAILVWNFREAHRALIVVAVCATVAVGLFTLYGHQRTHVLEAPAAQWIADHPAQVEVDDNTRRHLALVSAVEKLPRLGSGRAYLIYNSTLACQAWLIRSHLKTSFDVAGEVKISKMSWLEPRYAGALCLLHYLKPVPGPVVLNAIRKSRPDGPFILGVRKSF